MTNKDFIDALALKTGKTKKETKEFCDAFETVLKETVVNSKIKVADLTFAVKDVAERSCCNPKTGEKMVVPACKKLSVKASSDYKRLVNE